MAKSSLRRLIKIATGTSMEKELFRGETKPARLEHVVHFWGFVGRSFVQNRCLIRACALSYTTLLAMIPLLAIAIGITSSLLKNEGEKDIYKAIDKVISHMVPPATVAAAPSYQMPNGSPTNSATTATNVIATSAGSNTRVAVQNVVADEIHTFIHNTRSGALGVTGVAVLIIVAISMLNSIEGTFNDIWGIQTGRNWLTRVGRFWIALTLGPLLVAVAIGLAGGSSIQHVTSAIAEKVPFVEKATFELFTFVFIWILFALMYKYVPNTKVQFSAALAGGITAGTLWHLNNIFGFLYVSRVVSNSRIYGGLGLIPVFMAGLYFSWAILLFGAQTAYAFQNRKIYLQEKAAEDVTWRDREILALQVMTTIGRRFQNGEPPVTSQEIADELEISSRLIQQVLQPLLNTRIITETSDSHAYTPARPLDFINVHDILQAMRAGTEQGIALPKASLPPEVLGEFEKIEKAERAAATPITLLALVQHTHQK